MDHLARWTFPSVVTCRQLPAAAAIESTPLPLAGTHHWSVKQRGDGQCIGRPSHLLAREIA